MIFAPNADFAALFPRFLDRLPDGSVVMCHPGFVDAELQRLDPLTTLREREYAFFADDAFPKVLAAERCDVGLTPGPSIRGDFSAEFYSAGHSAATGAAYMTSRHHGETGGRQ